MRRAMVKLLAASLASLALTFVFLKGKYNLSASTDLREPVHDFPPAVIHPREPAQSQHRPKVFYPSEEVLNKKFRQFIKVKTSADNLTYQSIESLLTRIEHNCTKPLDLGKGAHAWQVCTGGLFRFLPGHCGVYSFSQSSDGTIEETLGEKLNCTVRLVQYLNPPAKRKQKHVAVVPIKLSGFFNSHDRTMMETLDSLHDEDSVLDVVRIQAATSKHLISVFKSIFYNKTLRKVKQLALTLVVSKLRVRGGTFSLGPDDTRWLLGGLYEAGFRRWSSETEEKHRPLEYKGPLGDLTAFHMFFINVNAQHSHFAAPLEISPLPANLTWSQLTAAQAEEQFEKYVMEVHYNCTRPERVGLTEDGGWDVCLDRGLLLNSPCLVYSFGINWDFSFDDDVSKRFGCQVRSFDPSMKLEDKARSKLVNFYRRGLGGRKMLTNQGWKIDTFGNLVEGFNDTKRDIDILKFDIEGSEWEALAAMLEDGSLERVKQLGLEIHKEEMKPRKPQTTTAVYQQYHKLLSSLEALGFRKWKVHRNQRGLFESNTSNTRKTCCFEMAYINTKYLAKKPAIKPNR